MSDDLVYLIAFVSAFVVVLFIATLIVTAFTGHDERRDAERRNHAHPRRWQ